MKCMSRLIPLTQGQFAIVDDDDFEWLSQWKWYAHKRPCTFYAERTEVISGRKVKVWMHRLISGTPERQFTDHIDGNGLNNVRQNLRNVSHQDNMVNRARWRRGSTSQYRGAYLDKRDGRWFSSITINGRNIHIGRFATPEDAASAYEKRRAELRAGQIYRR